MAMVYNPKTGAYENQTGVPSTRSVPSGANWGADAPPPPPPAPPGGSAPSPTQSPTTAPLSATATNPYGPGSLAFQLWASAHNQPAGAPANDGGILGSIAKPFEGFAHTVGTKINDLSGQTARDAANAAAATQQANAASSQSLAAQQQNYINSLTQNAQGYYNPAQSAYQALFGQGTPGTPAPPNTSNSSVSTVPGWNPSAYGTPLQSAGSGGQYSVLPNSLSSIGGTPLPRTAIVGTPGTPAGSMTMPGLGEQAFTQYGSRLTDPTNSQNFYNTTAQQLAGPSAAESFFNPAAYQRTTNAENFYNNQAQAYGSNTMNDAYGGLFSALNNSPMASSYQGFVSDLSGGPMSQSYQGYVNSLYGGAMSQSQPQLDALLSQQANTQGLYGATYSQYNNDAMSAALGGLSAQASPGNSVLSQNYAGQNAAFAAPDAQDQMRGDITNLYNSSNMLGANLGNFEQIGANSLAPRSQQASELMFQEQQPSVTASEYGNIRPTYSNQGMFENFVQGAMDGNDPYFKMLQEEQTANLDASMNARGGYNSGGAIQALGKQNATLEALKYAQMAGLTQGAQGMQLQRASGLQGLAGQAEGELQQRLKAQDTIGQENYNNLFGLNQFNAGLTQAAGQEQRDIAGGLVNQGASLDNARLGRMMGQIQLGGATDQATLARTVEQGNLANMAATQRLNYMGQRADLANMADTKNLGQITERGNLANMADVAQYNRTMGQSQITNAADVAQMNRVNSQANITNQADQAQYNRTMGQGTLANMTAGQNLNYLNSWGQAAQGADTSYLNLLQGGQNAANSASSAQLARIMGGGQLANSADSNNRANTMGYLGAGVNAQQLAESRQMAAFNAAMGLGGAQSGLAMQGGLAGASAYDQWMANSMGLQGNAAQIRSNAANAQTAQTWGQLQLGAPLLGGPVGGAAAGALAPQAQPQLNASFQAPQFTPGGYSSQLQVDPYFMGPNPYVTPTW